MSGDVTPTPGTPTYTKFKQDRREGTAFWGIQVNEGWREWILCCDMYEWAADDLLVRLRWIDRPWPHAS